MLCIILTFIFSHARLKTILPFSEQPCLVDIMSQKIFLTKNSSKKTSTVTGGFLRNMKNIPEKARKTLTLDNGKEFVKHVIYMKIQGLN